MKKLLTIAVAMMAFMAAEAKDIKTVVLTPTPQMHCDKCEAKIKNALKFEKGIKDIQTNVGEQTVTVKYDAEKTSTDKIAAVMKKAGYETKEKKAKDKK